MRNIGKMIKLLNAYKDITKGCKESLEGDKIPPVGIQGLKRTELHRGDSFNI